MFLKCFLWCFGNVFGNVFGLKTKKSACARLRIFPSYFFLFLKSSFDLFLLTSSDFFLCRPISYFLLFLLFFIVCIFLVFLPSFFFLLSFHLMSSFFLCLFVLFLLSSNVLFILSSYFFLFHTYFYLFLFLLISSYVNQPTNQPIVSNPVFLLSCLVLLNFFLFLPMSDFILFLSFSTNQPSNQPTKRVQPEFVLLSCSFPLISYVNQATNQPIVQPDFSSWVSYFFLFLMSTDQPTHRVQPELPLSNFVFFVFHVSSFSAYFVLFLHIFIFLLISRMSFSV